MLQLFKGRPFGCWLCALSCVFTPAGFSTEVEPNSLSLDRPNVLIILMDDFGIGQFAPMIEDLELGDIDPGLVKYAIAADTPYSPAAALEAARLAMPFMETLADAGILFNRAFSASSLCAPSRQGLLTGNNPIRWGAYRNIDINICGLPKGRSLVPLLQEQGYRTGFIGKWHVGSRDHSMRDEIKAAGGTKEDVVNSGYWGSVIERDHPLNHGFDYAFFYNLWECQYYNARNLWENREYTGVQPEYNTDLFTRKALEFIDKSVSAGDPFFVELALHAVHIPLDVDAPEQYRNQINTGDAAVDRFYSHVYAVDQSVKRIVDHLKASGEWENTVLLFTSDNGATCKIGKGDLSLIPGNATHRGHKGQYFLGGVRVPLLMVGPILNVSGVEIERMVSLMDVLPTALELAGAEVPANIDGKSLLPLLNDPEGPHHKSLYFAGIHAPAWGYTAQGVIGDAEARRDLFPVAWAVITDDHILRFVGALNPGLLYDSPTGQASYHELYDHVNDPPEAYNLFTTHPELAQRMMADYQVFAADLPPPHKWNERRWSELMPDSNPLRSTSWQNLPAPGFEDE